MSTKFLVAALIYPMVQAVMFGAGFIGVLLSPWPAAGGIPVMVLATALASAPVSWLIAPRLMLRFNRPARTAHA